MDLLLDAIATAISLIFLSDPRHHQRRGRPRPLHGRRRPLARLAPSRPRQAQALMRPVDAGDLEVAGLPKRH